MKVALVFDPDDSLGPDPLDDKAQPRRLGEWWDTDDSIDLLLVVREYGDQFDGGSRIHIYPAGAWEHVTPKGLRKILDRLGAL